MCRISFVYCVPFDLLMIDCWIINIHMDNNNVHVCECVYTYGISFTQASKACDGNFGSVSN